MFSIVFFFVMLIVLGTLKMPRFKNRKVDYVPLYRQLKYYQIIFAAPTLVVLVNIIFFQQLLHLGGIVMVLTLIYGLMILSKYIFEKHFIKHMEKLGLVNDSEN